MTKKLEPKGVNFLNLLALVFIHLKLSGSIVWAWGWVLSPMVAWFLITVLALYLVKKGRV